MALTTNLILNPSFKEGTDYWTATGGSTSIASATSGGYYGSYCLTVTKSADANAGAVTNTTAITVTVGDTYVASAYVKVPTGEESGNLKVGIGYYDVSDSLIDSTIYYSNATAVTSSSGWVRLYKTATAPSASVYAKVFVVQNNVGTAGETFLIDAVQLENSYDPTPFVETLTQAQETAAVNDGLRPVPVPHITGMELNADIMLNGLLLNTVDYNKCVWVCTDIEGWWGVPDPEVPELTRGLDDGSYDVRGRWTARDMTLTGTVLVPNKNYAETARQRLIEAISLVHSGGWLFVGESPTKAAYVRLSGRPEISNINARGRMDFSIGLRAANPIKYSWNWNDQNGYTSTTITHGSSASITNSGNISVPVTLILEGGLTAPVTIENTTTGTTLTIIKDLRAQGYQKNITNAVQSGTAVTLTLGANHGFLVDDKVSVANVTTTSYTGLNTDDAVTITSVTATTISYTSASTRTLASAVCNGDVSLDSKDTLEIDTYNKSALFRGSASVARSYIDAVVDWTLLQPGANTIEFTPTGGTTSLTVKHRSGWIG